MLDEGVRLGVISELNTVLVHMDEGPGELLELRVGPNPGHEEAGAHYGGPEDPGLLLEVDNRN